MKIKPTPATVRVMQIADLPAARTLWEKTESVGLTPDETPPMLAAFLTRNPGISSVAMSDDGRLLGAMLGGHDGRRGYLYHLAVVPEYRGRGLARSLVAHSLGALAAEGIAKASVMVYADNKPGLAFWERLGWNHREDLKLMQAKSSQ
jgi:ribosomal protein S18 acetylase RimI-like enzyme